MCFHILPLPAGPHTLVVEDQQSRFSRTEGIVFDCFRCLQNPQWPLDVAVYSGQGGADPISDNGTSLFHGGLKVVALFIIVDAGESGTADDGRDAAVVRKGGQVESVRLSDSTVPGWSGVEKFNIEILPGENPFKGLIQFILKLFDVSVHPVFQMGQFLENSIGLNPQKGTVFRQLIDQRVGDAVRSAQEGGYLNQGDFSFLGVVSIFSNRALNRVMTIR
jgi:hypothetical protein